MTHSAARSRVEAGAFGSIIALQQVVAAAESPLLEPRDRLGESSARGVAIGLLEFGQLHPSNQRSGSNADRAGSFIDVALRQDAVPSMLRRKVSTPIRCRRAAWTS
jgi:hypothetical protein